MKTLKILLAVVLLIPGIATLLFMVGYLAFSKSPEAVAFREDEEPQ